jgi:phosphatidylinositol alpha-1,6-mannosyltransferase
LEITNDFPPTVGGIENYIYSVVARWPPGEVLVLTRLVDGSESVDATLRAEVLRRPASTLWPTRALYRQILELMASRAFDVVHFSSALPLAVLGPKILRDTGIPYAVSVHGGEFIAGARLVRPLMQRALCPASVVLPVSSFTQAAVLRLLSDPPPTEVVTPGVDPCQFAPGIDPELERPPGGFVILAVSRLIARKGPATLIAALPDVLARHPRTVLAIVGDGPDRHRLERAARALGVSAAVRFLGRQPWSRLGGFYASADVFALPTRERFGGLETEGFPLVYLEAASAGLPVVAGRAGGVGEAVVDGETGFIVDGRSASETAAALLRLLDDRALARRMGTEGRRRVAEAFTWDGAVERFRTALEKHTR